VGVTSLSAMVMSASYHKVLANGSLRDQSGPDAARDVSKKLHFAWRNRPAHVDELSQWRARLNVRIKGDNHDDYGVCRRHCSARLDFVGSVGAVDAGKLGTSGVCLGVFADARLRRK
jgi:hypothetical protein